MFSNIAVAYDESPESHRAMAAAFHLAKTLHVGLQAITVMEKLPAFTAFAAGSDPTVASMLADDREKYYDHLQTTAREAAQREGIELVTTLANGEPVDAIVRFVCERKIDLLVVGLHRHHDRVSRLWSTTTSIAHSAPCDIFGVH
jgi:nucleotide-binding universal stress UspA family protein